MGVEEVARADEDEHEADADCAELEVFLVGRDRAEYRDSADGGVDSAGGECLFAGGFFAAVRVR